MDGGNADIGHNSKRDVSAARLKSFVQRVERLNEERKAPTADIAEVFAECKSAGFEIKIVREVIKRRAMDPDDLANHDALLGVYENAVRG